MTETQGSSASFGCIQLSKHKFSPRRQLWTCFRRTVGFVPSQVYLYRPVCPAFISISTLLPKPKPVLGCIGAYAHYSHLHSACRYISARAANRDDTADKKPAFFDTFCITSLHRRCRTHSHKLIHFSATKLPHTACCSSASTVDTLATFPHYHTNSHTPWSPPSSA